MKYLYIQVNIGFAGATHEQWEPLPDNWDTMTDDAKLSLQTEWEQEVVNNTIGSSSRVVENEYDTD